MKKNRKVSKKEKRDKITYVKRTFTNKKDTVISKLPY